YTAPEHIAMRARLCPRRGRAGIRLEINSIGDAEERRAHRAALIAHLQRYRQLINEDEQRRLQTNPLPLLDSKNPALQPAIAAAPKLIDSLGLSARAHFDE